MKTLFKTIAPFLLIAMFSYAAVSKLLIFEAFRQQLARQPFPHFISVALSYALPAAETLAVLLLIFTRTRRKGLVLSLALLGGFTLYILLILVGYWEKVPCPCGGILNHFSWTQHLLFNLAFLLITLAGLMGTAPSAVPKQSFN